MGLFGAPGKQAVWGGAAPDERLVCHRVGSPVHPAPHLLVLWSPCPGLSHSGRAPASRSLPTAPSSGVFDRSVGPHVWDIMGGLVPLCLVAGAGGIAQTGLQACAADGRSSRAVP